MAKQKTVRVKSNPSPEEIAAMCKQIRSKWPATRLVRAAPHLVQKPVETHVISQKLVSEFFDDTNQYD